MIKCKNCGNEITYHPGYGFRHVEGIEPPMTRSMEICGKSEFEPEITRALESVLVERMKQDDHWGEQNHNPYIYLAILLEELGELAQSVLQTQFGGHAGGWHNVRKEAVHTAAVALALLECLDRDKWTEDDVHLSGDEDGKDYYREVR
jgi:NTP pyrophosphatase (non-canonical NTP hydrolase)